MLLLSDILCCEYYVVIHFRTEVDVMVTKNKAYIRMKWECCSNLSLDESWESNGSSEHNHGGWADGH